MKAGEAPSVASAQEPSTTGDVPEPEKEEYVRQKYINQDSHLNLTRAEVEGMLEQVLESSPTVKYLLESLSLVSLGLQRGPSSRALHKHPITRDSRHTRAAGVKNPCQQ
jgi:hypothetical protein